MNWKKVIAAVNRRADKLSKSADKATSEGNAGHAVVLSNRAVELIELAMFLNAGFEPEASTVDQVKEFNKAFNLPVPDKPTLDEESVPLQILLMREEFDEMIAAYESSDIVEVLDGLIDMQYILDGLFIKFGMADIKEVAFDEVHASNMSKLGEDGKPILREDGKILKGPNYFKPNLAQFLELTEAPETKDT